MKRALTKWGQRWRRRSGQTLFEYTIILSAVAVICVLILRNIGSRPPEMMQPVEQELAN